jgi:hypothetical protein
VNKGNKMKPIMSISLHKSNVTGKLYLRFCENHDDGCSSDTPIELEELDGCVAKLLEGLKYT